MIIEKKYSMDFAMAENCEEVQVRLDIDIVSRATERRVGV